MQLPLVARVCDLLELLAGKLEAKASQERALGQVVRADAFAEAAEYVRRFARDCAGPPPRE